MPHPRRQVSIDELHELLAHEFAATAADLCTACRVPRPVFLAARGDGPNWRVPPLDECPALCHTILQDIAEKLGRQYRVLQ
jgi:hypothetical protein